jgi:hypothetical protein
MFVVIDLSGWCVVNDATCESLPEIPLLLNLLLARFYFAFVLFVYTLPPAVHMQCTIPDEGSCVDCFAVHAYIMQFYSRKFKLSYNVHISDKQLIPPYVPISS